MPQQRPYLTEADKGAFLGRIDDGIDTLLAAKRARIHLTSARRIKKRSDDIQVYNDNYDLPPPSMYDRTAVKSKSGRTRVLSEVAGNQLKDAIEQDRYYREMGQFDVAQELRIKASILTVRNEMKARNLNRVKPTKKLALTPIQRAIRYEIALSRKDWTLEDWKRVVWTDEASILVREHRGKHLISRTPDNKYEEDCIEVRYNNYSEAIF